MSDSPPHEPAGKPALWRSLVPSLAILAGTFFFISAACFSDGDSGYDYNYTPCAAHADTTAPSGAFVTIVRPEPEEVFPRSEAGGLLYVAVQLRANGVEIVAADECRAQTGHFRLSLRRIAGQGCTPAGTIQPVELTQGDDEYVYRLPPGSYELGAAIVTGSGASYVPPLTTAVHFVVDGEPLGPDGGLCE